MKARGWVLIIIVVFAAVIVAGLYWPSSSSLPGIPSATPTKPTPYPPRTQPIPVNPSITPTTLATTTTPTTVPIIPTITLVVTSSRTIIIIDPTNTIYAGESHLDLSHLHLGGGSFELRMYVGNDVTGAFIYTIPVLDVKNFNVDISIPYYGRYYAVGLDDIVKGDPYYVIIEPAKSSR